MKRALKVSLPLLVLAGGTAAAILLVKTRPKAQRASAQQRLPRVDVTKVGVGEGPARVEGMGTVMPSKSITLHAEVTGRILWQSSKLVPGGRFSRGEVVARIDPRDYRLRLEQQRAAVERARVGLQLERGRGRVATREWRSFRRQGLGVERTGGELAQRQPQLRAARSDLAAAKAALARARLDVSRTTIRAPFNAVVTAETVDVGQLVTPQSPLATLVGTDTFWVKVSLPVAKLGWLRLPSGERAGSPARVEASAANAKASPRTGRVVRLLGELEPKGRLARLLVSVTNPLGGDGVPLLLGSYVRVTIEGRALTSNTAVPRLALQDGDSVIEVDAQGRLKRRAVRIAWRARNTVYLASDAASPRPGARVVLGRLPGARDGMRVAPVLVAQETELGANGTGSTRKPAGPI